MAEFILAFIYISGDIKIFFCGGGVLMCHYLSGYIVLISWFVYLLSLLCLIYFFYCFYLFHSLYVFCLGVSRWSFTGMWVTSCLLDSSQYSGWSQKYCNQLVTILPLISNSLYPLFKHLVTVPSAPTTIGITITLLFDNFLSFLAKSKYLLIFLLSCIFTQWSTRTTNPLDGKFLFSF